MGEARCREGNPGFKLDHNHWASISEEERERSYVHCTHLSKPSRASGHVLLRTEQAKHPYAASSMKLEMDAIKRKGPPCSWLRMLCLLSPSTLGKSLHEGIPYLLATTALSLLWHLLPPMFVSDLGNCRLTLKNRLSPVSTCLTSQGLCDTGLREIGCS